MMGGRKADRPNREMLGRIVALLLAIAGIAERASAMPVPARCIALHFLRRAALAAHSYVYWAARDCGSPLQWTLPDAVGKNSSREAALALAWWLRILAVALRDLPRRAFAVRMARLHWQIELGRAACPAGLATGRPIAFDTS
jgi:hypothetical protein